MSYVRLGSSKAGTSNGLTFTTPSFNVASGTSLITGYVADYAGVAGCTLTNNHSDAVVMGTEQVVGSFDRVRAFWIINPTPDSAYTLTATQSGSFFPGLAWAWYSGGHASPFLSENGSTGGTVGNLVPSEDNCLLTCGSVHQQAGTTTTVLTEVQDQAFVGGTSFGTSFAEEIQTTAATRNPTVSAVDACAGTVFRAAGAAPPPATGADYNFRRRQSRPAPFTPMGDGFRPGKYRGWR